MTNIDEIMRLRGQNPINLYINNAESYTKLLAVDYYDPAPCSVREIDDGFILPYKKDEKKGGILDKDRNYVEKEQCFFMNWGKCDSGYEFDEFDEIDETVVFGGMLYNRSSFGHTLVDGFSRLWYADKTDCKFVFIARYTKGNISDFIYKFLDMSGIKNFIIIKKPTKFKKIIIPEQSMKNRKFRNEIYTTVDRIKKYCAEKAEIENWLTYDKVYFTRSQSIRATKYIVNEEYFEKFYENNGYTVISPEKLPLEQQVWIWSQAKEVACTHGSLSHMAIFTNRTGIKFTCLLLVEFILLPQLLLFRLANNIVDYVDISCNYMPTTAAYGTYLLHTTKWFKNYVLANNLKPLDHDLQFKDSLIEYMRAWANLYNDPKGTLYTINKKSIQPEKISASILKYLAEE